MNKLGMVFGLAAVATLAGCKDPDFKRTKDGAQNEVTTVDTAEPKAAKTCTCAPGTKHAEPCTCGAPDCKCTVEKKPVATADLSKDAPAPAPEYTVYVVQNGDYLAKISKKFNVTINSIKRLNPSIKKDVIWVGQKLKLPGKVDVGVQTEPAKTTAAKAPAKKTYAPYTGATKEYVVKNGDTLGGVAYGNGLNIRQLKELNGLSSDALKVGQKLKVPADGAAPAATTKADVKKLDVTIDKKTDKVVDTKPVAAISVEAAPAAPAAPADATAVPDAEDVKAVPPPAEPPAAPAKAEGATMTYLVQEGDDMTGVSIRWGVSAADIRELNNLGENDKLVPGQVIKLPADAQQ